MQLDPMRASCWINAMKSFNSDPTCEISGLGPRNQKRAFQQSTFLPNPSRPSKVENICSIFIIFASHVGFRKMILFCCCCCCRCCLPWTIRHLAGLRNCSTVTCALWSVALAAPAAREMKLSCRLTHGSFWIPEIKSLQNVGFPLILQIKAGIRHWYVLPFHCFQEPFKGSNLCQAP